MNYSFIFGFKQGTELGYHQVLFVSFVLAALTLGSVLANLDMQIDPATKEYKTFTELLPLILVLVRLLPSDVPIFTNFVSFVFKIYIVNSFLLCRL